MGKMTGDNQFLRLMVSSDRSLENTGRQWRTWRDSNPRHPGPKFGTALFRPYSRPFVRVRYSFSKPIVSVCQTASHTHGCRRPTIIVVKLWSEGALRRLAPTPSISHWGALGPTASPLVEAPRSWPHYIDVFADKRGRSQNASHAYHRRVRGASMPAAAHLGIEPFLPVERKATRSQRASCAPWVDSVAAASYIAKPLH